MKANHLSALPRVMGRASNFLVCILFAFIGLSSADLSAADLTAGCTDPDACNYDPAATTSTATCTGDFFSLVGSPGFMGGSSAYVSMEIHPGTGQPWVAFRDDSNGQALSVMRFDGTDWVYVNAPAISPAAALFVDLKFDPATNDAFVAIRDGSQSGRIAVIKYDGTSWSNLGGAVSTGNADHCAIAINPADGNPWVVYQDQANGFGIRANRWTGTSWVVVGSGNLSSGIGANPIIEFNPANGNAIVAYQDNSAGQKLTVRQSTNGTSWSTLGSGLASTAIRRPDISFKPSNGEIYVAYTKWSSGKGEVATYNGSWSFSPEILNGFADNFRTEYDAVNDRVLVVNDGSGQNFVKTLQGGVWVQVGNTLPSTDFYVDIAIQPESGLPYVACASNSSFVFKMSCEISGCTDAAACNYDPAANSDDGSCLIIGQSCDDGIPCTINDVVDENCECHGTPNDGICDDGVYCNGQEYCDPELGCQVIPVVLDDGDLCTIDTCDEATDSVIHTPAPDSDGDGICDLAEVPGCTDPLACNYDPSANVEDGSCQLPDGCTDPGACNYDPAAACDDGSCDFVSCQGCTDSTACNYDATATQDDGSCDFFSCQGCTDSTACNYEATATQDDGSCILPDGCTDAGACNYDPTAVCDNGSCDFTSCVGCTNPVACNYDANATDDDGSCLDQLGCTDAGACNYDPAANCDDSSCEFVSCAGCTDPASCDYDPTATIEDGSCLVYPGDACDDGNVYTSNDEIQADCSCQGQAIDSDSDGLYDELEIEVYGSDPNLQDSDYDGLTDGLEVNIAGTSPTNPDTNSDGCDDASEFSGACGGAPECPADLNGDDFVDTADLLAFLGAFGTPCP